MEKAPDGDSLLAQMIAAQLEQEGNGEFFQVMPETSSPNVPSHISSGPWITDECASMLSRPCESCGDVGENWVCLQTRKVLCSRYRNGCAVRHATAQDLCALHLSTVDLSVWDHKMGAYLDVFAIEELRPAFTALHLAKHGTPPVFPDMTPVLDLGGMDLDDDDDKKPAAKTF
mmetsp:Transcript_24788/g.49326  ORF Transcript_24788/g.49326 Transcript_24788/m.49326 type:complete len:173 (-) Transcript_24788:114-632(-)